MLASSDRNCNVGATSTADLVHRVEQNGFAVVPSCLNEEIFQSLGAQLDEGSYAKRNLLVLPIVREVAASPAVRNLTEAVLGKHCLAVKGTFFNKTKESNWKVAWHQDLTIIVPRFGVSTEEMRVYQDRNFCSTVFAVPNVREGNSANAEITPDYTSKQSRAG